MSLPKVEYPVYELDLPLSKQHIRFRPFVVKEQRNLMMALESRDSDTIEQNIRQIVQNCLVTDKIDVEKLPIVDVEYLFVNLRARSIGEIVKSTLECDAEITAENGEKKFCSNKIDVDVDLLNLNVEHKGDVTDTIRMNDTITVKLKYPPFSLVKRIKESEDNMNFLFTLIAESIEWIHDGQQYHYAHEQKPEDLVDFVESLNQPHLEKLENFFDNLPRLKKEMTAVCNKCGKDHDIEIEGLESFFV